MMIKNMSFSVSQLFARMKIKKVNYRVSSLYGLNSYEKPPPKKLTENLRKIDFSALGKFYASNRIGNSQTTK